MAQKPRDKRAERREKSERNMNRAVIMLMAGLVAEWYLLMADRFFARGTVTQMLGWAAYLETMVWVGLVMLAGGAVLLALRKNKPWFPKAGKILLAAGAFFAFTSASMRYVYPVGVTVMCVMVPVLLILGIIWLFYQAEFAVQATALAMALGAILLLGRSSSGRVRLCAVLALAAIAALFVCSAVLKKNGGVFARGNQKLRVFGPKVDYRPLFAVLALCFVLVLAALFVPAVSFYGTWVLAILAFLLAVYYTMKLM